MKYVCDPAVTAHYIKGKSLDRIILRERTFAGNLKGGLLCHNFCHRFPVMLYTYVQYPLQYLDVAAWPEHTFAQYSIRVNEQSCSISDALDGLQHKLHNLIVSTFMLELATHFVF